MTIYYWRGDSQAIAQETQITFANIEPGDKFNLRVNGKAVSYTAVADDTAALVIGQFVEAIGQFGNSIAEWAEVSASEGVDDAGNTTYLKLTGKDDGTPFTVTADTENVTVFNITVAEIQKGSAVTNQKQRVRLAGPPTSGNFTLTIQGSAATANIAYNALAATVKTAVEGLTGVGGSNTTVTKNADGDWTIEFNGALVGTNLPLLSGTNVSLAGAAQIKINVKTEGRPANYAKGPSLLLTITSEPVDSFRFKFTGGSGFSGLEYKSTLVTNGSTGATADQIRAAIESIQAPTPLVDPSGTVDAPAGPYVQVYTSVDVTGPAGGPWEILIRDGIAAAFVSDALVLDTVYSVPGDVGNGTMSLDLVSAASTTAITEVQSMAFTNGPTGGTFILSWLGSSTPTIQYLTDGIAYNVAGSTALNSYDIRDALCDVGIAYDAGSGIILGRNELQTLTATGTWSAGNFTLDVINPIGTTSNTGNVAFNTSASNLQTKINNAIQSTLSGAGSTYAGESLYVECGGGPLPGTPITIKYRKSMGRKSVAAATFNLGTVTGAGPGGTVGRTVAGVDADVWVTGSGTPSDPFLITFDHWTTSTNVFNFASTGTGRQHASKDVQMIAVNTNSLTGASIIADLIQRGSLGINEQQEIAITPNVPTGGTFTLTFNSETTTGIAYNADAATVQTAIEALATPVAGDVSVTGGPLPGTPIVIEFKGAYANTDVAIMSGVSSLTGTNNQSTTITTTTTPTGPNYIDNTANYSPSGTPGTGDIVILADSSTDILWANTGLTGTLAEYHQRASFTGQIGLKPINNLSNGNFFEYRTKAITIKATKQFYGEGTGSGSSFTNIDNGNVQTEAIVSSTGQSTDNTTPALCLKGTHASNIYRFNRGDWGIAFFTGDTATVATIQVGYINDKESDSIGRIGAGCTWTALQVSGGNTTIEHEAANAESLTATGGVITVNGTKGINTTFAISGGAYVFWNTTGNLNASPIVVADGCVLDFSQDMRLKNIPSPIDVYGTGNVVDTNQVALSMIVTNDPFQIIYGMAINYHYTDVVCNDSLFGSNAVVSRAVPGT